MPGATRSARRSGNEESPPSESADAFRKTPRSASASIYQPTELSREVGRSWPRARAPTAAPAPTTASVGIPRSSAATTAAMETPTSVARCARPCRPDARMRRPAVAIVIPPVTGATPARAARASGDAAITPYAAVSAIVISAAGIIIPATAATTPRQPAMRRPISPASATRWIPGESCDKAQASPNSRALIHRSRSTARRRISSRVLVPPPTACVPTATHERVNLASMPVNLAVMDVVGRQEAPVFTWNPVEQMWVQERGGAAKPPPAPHDIHAIQTWFLDTEDNEWIQTVLGPMGRQLAAQWRGAHRVPEGAVARQPKTKKKRNPLPILVGAAVLIALVGGVAVAAPGLMNPNATPAPSG